MKQLAHFISVLFNPLLFASVFALLISANFTNTEGAFEWAIVSLIFIFLFFLLTFSLVKLRIFSNLDVSKRRNRFLLYPIALLFVMLYLLVSILFKGPLLYTYGAVLIALAIVVLDLVNHKIKASVHVGTISAAVVTTSYLYGPLYLLLFFFVFLVAWSRIVLGRHTLSEVVVGSGIGTMLAVIGMLGVQYVK